jgi:NADP-dependent 3-hydroxy-3-methylglutaryl-CoA reductase
VRLEIPWEGGLFTGVVHDLSEGGMRVGFGRGAWAAPRDTTLHGVRLLSARLGHPVTLGALTVRRSAHFNATRVMALLAADEATQATLWHSLQRLAWAGPWPGAATHADGEPLPKLPARGQYTEAARLERLAWLREQTGASLAPLETTRLQPEKLTGNLENMVGAVEVPVGLAGPLLFRGHAAQGLVYAPLATTEGALVASATRGATAISRSGGVTTRVLEQRMMRVPVFVLSSLPGALLFAEWIRDHLHVLREQVGAVSRHAHLVSVEPVIVGRMVHVYFLYQTGDAAGQNMTTACTWQACQWLMRQMDRYPEVSFENFIIEANMSGDKKVTFASFVGGRGTRVVADVQLTHRVLESVLKVTADELYTSYSCGTAGSIHAGMIGFNINCANVVAAIFTATGQDIASVHESSLAHLFMEKVPEGIHASMVLPSLVIGTVGGGTHLPAQNALLEMMGCAGTGKANRLAEIIAGFCLALDLSTLSAIASGEFANAHERLGRNRPVAFLGEADLGPAFFEPALRRQEGDQALRAISASRLDVATGSSIVTELTARKISKLAGLLPMKLAWESRGTTREEEIVVKVKPLDAEVILMVNASATQCGAMVGAAHNRHKDKTGFAGCHVRELAVYEQTDPRFRRHVPRVLLTHRDEAREAYVVAMERIAGPRFTLLDATDNARAWSQKAVEAALQGIAEVHAVWYGREDELRAQPWLGFTHTTDSMTAMSELWEGLAVHAADEFPEMVTAQRLEKLREAIQSIPLWWPRVEEGTRTLVHNDFSPRNVAMRVEDGGELRLCAYDWELATLHLPQRDVAEFLCFVLGPTTNRRIVAHLLEVHRAALEKASGVRVDPQAYRDGYVYALLDFAVNRTMLLLMAHTFRHYPFMEHVVETLFHLLDMELEGLEPTAGFSSGRFRV